MLSKGGLKKYGSIKLSEFVGFPFVVNIKNVKTKFPRLSAYGRVRKSVCACSIVKCFRLFSRSEKFFYSVL